MLRTCQGSTAIVRVFAAACSGYVDLSDEDGRRTCEDRNECVEYPELCGRLLDPRAACENLPGSFQCKPVLEQQCSEERGWGGCWTGEANNRFYSSCEARPQPPTSAPLPLLRVPHIKYHLLHTSQQASRKTP